MNCLPIAGRELRVAARKRSTFWLRVAAALVGLVLGGGCLLLGTLQRAGAAQMGGILFAILTWVCLAAGLSAGLFFTSDALSEEKREGTLGLLFLTDLRGYDVAAGKMMATSLRGFYGLLAVLPILAMTLLMGGITGAQYWKGSLALVNGLFFSLAAGMLVSAVSRDSQKAMAATLFLLLLFALGGPIADGMIAGVKKRAFTAVWSLSSPAYALQSAGAWGRSGYWDAILVTQLAGWAMFALACLLVPHTWQERKPAHSGVSRGWAYAWKFGGRARRARRSRNLLGRDPVAWLVSREQWQAVGLWSLTILVLGSFVYGLLKKIPLEAWLVWNYIGGLFMLLIYLAATSLACRFLVEARRSGLLELLLASPLDERQIVRGQWRALLRMFGLPVLLLLCVDVTASTLSQLSFLGITTQARTAMSAAAANQSRALTNRSGSTASSVTTVTTGGVTIITTTVGTNTTTRSFPASFSQTGTRAQQILTATVAAGSAALRTGANLVALVWFGLWMGLTSKSANLATLRTLLFVQVIPWFIIAFASSIGIGLLFASLGRAFSSGPPTWFMWWPLLNALAATVLATGKDVGFVLWSRKRLFSAFREQAARMPGQPRLDAPPVLAR